MIRLTSLSSRPLTVAADICVRLMKMDEPIELLRHYLPTIYDVLSPLKKMISDISTRYYKRKMNVEAAIKKSGEFTSEKVIYDLWWDANEGDQSSMSFLTFINKTAKGVLEKVENNVKRQIVKLCHTMIINFNDSQSQYTNYIAELAVINKLLSDEGIELLQVEKIMPNGKRFDFEVKKDGKETLVEVFNINFNYERIESSDKFKDFLETRITDKLNSKLNELPGTLPPFLLVPVLWGNIRGLDQFADAFLFFKDFNFISKFMMIAEYKNLEGGYLYDFGTVEDFLKRASIIKKKFGVAL